LKRGTQTTAEIRRLGAAAGRPGVALDKAWLELVAALPSEKRIEEVAQELRRRNPEFDGKIAKHAIERGKVTSLHLRTDELTDLTPLRALPDLTDVGCWGTHLRPGKLAQLTPLRDLPLVALNCPFNRIEDLGPLRGQKLAYLNCHGNPISDLSPLAGMPLGRLDTGGTRVTDLTPLKGLPLTQLSIAEARVRSLAPLRDITTLEVLDCSGNPITDLTPLQGMPLRSLNLRRTGVTDLAPLENLPLIDLHADCRPERDGALLRRLPKLQRVNGKALADFLKEVKEVP
jgi:Leucine-rich repeat (LRR) protein